MSFGAVRTGDKHYGHGWIRQCREALETGIDPGHNCNPEQELSMRLCPMCRAIALEVDATACRERTEADEGPSDIPGQYWS